MDEFKEPLSRVEAILQNILGADNELLAITYKAKKEE